MFCLWEITKSIHNIKLWIYPWRPEPRSWSFQFKPVTYKELLWIFHFCFYLGSGLHGHAHNFMFFYLPWTKPDLNGLQKVSWGSRPRRTDWQAVIVWLGLDIGVQWLRVALSKGPNCVGTLHLKTGTDSVLEISCSLIFIVQKQCKMCL